MEKLFSRIIIFIFILFTANQTYLISLNSRKVKQYCEQCLSFQEVNKFNIYFFNNSYNYKISNTLKTSNVFRNYQNSIFWKHIHNWRTYGVSFHPTIGAGSEGHGHRRFRINTNYFAKKYEKNKAFRNFIDGKIKRKIIPLDIFHKYLVLSDFCSMTKKNMRISIASYDLITEYEKKK